MQRVSLISPEPQPFSVASKLVNESDLDRHVAAAAEAAPGTDVLVVPEHLSRTAPQLLIMDVDSTFINEEVIDLIGDRAGVGEEIARLTAEAMHGQADFATSLRARVSALAGVDASVIEEIKQVITLTDGARELVAHVQEHGGRVALVSGGFHEVITELASGVGITDIRANRFEIVDGRFTGRTSGPIIDRAAKAAYLRELVAEHALDAHYTVAIGDGANDIDMIEEAAFGVAFCAKPALREKADAALTVRHLDAVWAALTGTR